MERPKTGVVALDKVAAAAIAPLTSGRAKYVWLEADTLGRAGDWYGTFRATWGDGSKISFPDDGYIPIVIRKKSGT
jgi:hypothetical protein